MGMTESKQFAWPDDEIDDLAEQYGNRHKRGICQVCERRRNALVEVGGMLVCSAECGLAGIPFDDNEGFDSWCSYIDLMANLLEIHRRHCTDA